MGGVVLRGGAGTCAHQHVHYVLYYFLSQLCVHELAAKYLERDYSFNKQDNARLKIVYNEVGG